MSACGETINFYATSLGRNNFLHVATGVFGGDPSWGIGTYQPMSDQYRNSAQYRNTVATELGMYQRAPVSCWYTMGNAEVITHEAVGSQIHLQATWTISSGLWNTVRIPGQCFTFCDSGVLIHGIIDMQSTASKALIIIPCRVYLGKKYPLHPSTVNITAVPGDVLAYMVRQRPPRNVIMGPMQILSDGQTVAVQGNPNLSGFRAPEPGVHLLYLGPGYILVEWSGFCES